MWRKERLRIHGVRQDVKIRKKEKVQRPGGRKKVGRSCKYGRAAVIMEHDVGEVEGQITQRFVGHGEKI